MIVGIDEKILQEILKELNPEKAHIVAFLDNSEAKKHEKYLGRSVYTPKKFMQYKDNSNIKVDYYIVSALSAYQAIQWQLIELGVEQSKIQPFIPDTFCKYMLGSVRFDEDLIYDIYCNPTATMEIAHRYLDQYSRYNTFQEMMHKDDDWYNKASLIAHALGGRIGDDKLEYSNSLEAFKTAIKNRFMLFECDVCLEKENIILLSHDNGMRWICKEYNLTTMHFVQFLKHLLEYPLLTVLIDVKWENHREYTAVIHEIDKALKEIGKDSREYEALKNQIVMQVYDEETIICAKAYKFQMFFTQYRNPRKCEFMHTVDLCYRYGIKVVGMGLWPPELIQKKYMDTFLNKNIKLFAYSTDSVHEYIKLIDLGFTGVMTNFIRPKDVGAEDN